MFSQTLRQHRTNLPIPTAKLSVASAIDPELCDERRSPK
jgi:hypothetical protein